MGLSDVSNILWQERQLLELLLFKLEEEQLVLASGRARWLNHATREVEMVLEEIKRAELARSIEVDGLAAELGLEPGPSLRLLSETVEGPWKSIFEQHRRAFLTVTQEVMALAQVNRDLLSRGQKATREALAWLGDAEAEVYSQAGVASSAYSAGPRLVNEAL
jgi:hypothetical protein